MSAAPVACGTCLRRAWLVGSLAGHIEKIATGEVGRRSPQLLALSDAALAAAVAPNDDGRLLGENQGLEPRTLHDAVAAAGLWACCRHDGRFPAGLREAGDAPAVLFGRGDPDLLERLAPQQCVTVVGARKAGSYGMTVATQLGREIAAAGLLVVSGLAFGVDAAAHAGALETGTTVAVLGCGADLIYPARHRRLGAEVEERGLVLSELPPGTTPWRWAFPARNRIMAAMAGMTVVVEAAARSGSLITAEQAADLSRAVGAVPGPIGSRLSAGTNNLLADGAIVVRGTQDVLDALLGAGVRAVVPPTQALAPEPARVLEAVEAGCGEHDAIAVRSGLEPAVLARALSELELLGYVEATLAGGYVRTAVGAR